MRRKLEFDRNKQVQFRMPEETHKKLKIELTKNDSGFADFFNEVAEAYLISPEDYQLAITNLLNEKKG